MAIVVVATVAVATPVPAAVGSTVQMVDNEPDLTNWHFDPADLTVAVGSTVVWHNRGNQEHSVTADDNSFDSGLKAPGTDFQRAFPKIGVYSYHCRPHPWMTGKIHVVAADATAASASTATTATAAAPTTTTVAPPPTSRAGAEGSASSSTTAAAASSPGGTGTTSASGSSAAPAGTHHRSGGHLAGTIALVLGLTLAGLALGARLSRSRS